MGYGAPIMVSSVDGTWDMLVWSVWCGFVWVWVIVGYGAWAIGVWCRVLMASARVFGVCSGEWGVHENEFVDLGLQFFICTTCQELLLCVGSISR